MIIKLHTFKGQNKLYPAYAMPIELGQQAVNTYIENGTLKPMLGDTTFNLPVGTTVPSNTKTVYKHKNINTAETEWHFFTDQRTVVRHPVGTDTLQRIYYISDGKLKVKRFDWPDELDVLMPQPNPQNQLTVAINDFYVAPTEGSQDITAIEENISGKVRITVPNHGYTDHLKCDISITWSLQTTTITWVNNGEYGGYPVSETTFEDITTTKTDWLYIIDENTIDLSLLWFTELGVSESNGVTITKSYNGFISGTILLDNTSVTNNNTINRFIAFSFVNTFGEESALSLTNSGTGSYQYGNYYIEGLSEASSITVTWDSETIIPSGGVYHDNITKIRFYMTPVTTSADDYRFAGEALISDENITIENAGTDISISELVSSPVRLTYNDYETVTLLGVCKTSFGSIITWDAGNIYISDMRHPYIFSALSTYSIESEILSVNSFGTSFLVTTTTNPFVLTGTDPTAMLTEKAEQARGCLNKNCIVDMGSFICVPTDEGIYKIGTGTFELATKEMFSLNSWKDIIANGSYLNTATQYKNLYLLNLTTGTTLVFDFINNFFWELDYSVMYGYYDALEQLLYYNPDDTSKNTLSVFNNDTETVKEYSFKTGKFMLNAPVNFKYVRVFADDYDGTITLKAYDTGVLKVTRTITADDIVKLPSIKFNEVELEIISDRVINFINVSTTMEEILGA